MKLKTFFLIAILISNISIAQSKVGTVNSDYVLSIMPEGKKVVELTKVYAERLDSLFSIKVIAYQKKLEEFKSINDTVNQDFKTKKFTELQILETEVNKSKQKGSQLMRLKENELMKPLYKKLGEAISEVSKENNYTQILTVQGNEFAYIDRNFDITDLVIAKLNINKSILNKKE
ncbi:MAG: Uncharacterised protein [Polaribacter sp. SA4-10]|nr:MAG: Uncharacterised protein [Polaribacter sp. SA4-10]